jgi:hypothetical protein
MIEQEFSTAAILLDAQTLCPDCLMSSLQLSAYVNAWTVQAVTASRWLTRLYRSLGDDRQAATAIQAGAFAVERMNRAGLQDQVGPLQERFIQKYRDETQAEESAWTALVEALVGLSAFFSVTGSTDGKPAPGLQGARTATYGALRKAIRGFHTAFPDVIVDQDIASAIRNSASACVDAFLADIHETVPERRDSLRVGLEACVLEALGKAVTAQA